MVTGLGRCAFNSEVLRGDGERSLRSLIQLRIENIDSRNRKDGRRKLFSVFNNRHRKGLSSPPVMASSGEYNFGFKFNRPVKILNVNE